MIEKFMDTNSNHDRFPQLSRDWEIIECNATSCINNKSNICSVPSLAKINDQGKCTGYQANIKN